MQYIYLGVGISQPIKLRNFKLFKLIAIILLPIKMYYSSPFFHMTSIIRFFLSNLMATKWFFLIIVSWLITELGMFLYLLSILFSSFMNCFLVSLIIVSIVPFLALYWFGRNTYSFQYQQWAPEYLLYFICSATKTQFLLIKCVLL